ncbi:hypothetical protein D187_006384 [Cystobacter fuscus DSM 2262]|uniref:PIN domain-containing protein n=1 Tax=Cystobacter fuscus (strain ATCC 25194 / DSM 2262 / NBRC 100088 / M29) TaxID=1242864 RepID=S9QNU2_CYSF2|nr:hypothetical protein D187_006384 [Cystobacter fuscus DSM 2262]
MSARHVAFGQADGVPLLTTDRDLVAHEGNYGLSPFVVFDDELQHGLGPLTAIAERPRAPQEGYPS